MIIAGIDYAKSNIEALINQNIHTYSKHTNNVNFNYYRNIYEEKCY
jgi:hypothetical protein